MGWFRSAVVVGYDDGREEPRLSASVWRENGGEVRVRARYKNPPSNLPAVATGSLVLREGETTVLLLPDKGKPTFAFQFMVVRTANP